MLATLRTKGLVKKRDDAPMSAGQKWDGLSFLARQQILFEVGDVARPTVERSGHRRVDPRELSMLDLHDDVAG